MLMRELYISAPTDLESCHVSDKELPDIDFNHEKFYIGWVFPESASATEYSCKNS